MFLPKRSITAVVVLFFAFCSLLTSGLKDEANQADYLIITPVEFLAEFPEFTDWREDKGLKTMIVTLDEIRQEFGPVEESAAIGDFISYSLTYWQEPKPQYVLLAGSVNLIPSFKIESDFKDSQNIDEDSVSTDHFYSININENDILPDIAVGRFPVQNKEELKALIKKTMLYENYPDDLKYENDIAFFIDKDDFQAFESNMTKIETYFPEQTIAKFTNNPESEYFGSKQDFFDIYNSGARLMMNLCHGSPAVWFREGLINKGDFDMYIQDNKPSLLLSFSCHQAFDSLKTKTLIEELISNTNGGAAATILSSGTTYMGVLNKFFDGIYSKLNNEDYTIGRLVLEAKNNQGNGSYYIGLINILGDPALKVPFKQIAGINDQENISISIYPNPVSERMTVNTSGSPNKYYRFEIFDATGRILKQSNLISDITVIPGLEKFSNGTYYLRLISDSKTEIIPFVILK